MLSLTNIFIMILDPSLRQYSFLGAVELKVRSQRDDSATFESTYQYTVELKFERAVARRFYLPLVIIRLYNGFVLLSFSFYKNQVGPG